MKHQEYLNKYLGTFQREPWINSAECVWNAKLYSREVLGMKLGSFWGSARNWWENTFNTFPSKYWKRIKNTTKNVPTQGSIVFFDLGIYWHVGIVNTADKNSMTICEQNATGKPGDAPWDEIKVSLYKYTKCLGWYSLIIPEAIGWDVEPWVIEEYHMAPIPAPPLNPNTFKTLPHYNQTIEWECSFYACGAMISYNTGKVLKNTLLHNYWLTYCTPTDPSYPLVAAARIMAKDYKLNYINLKALEAEQLLDKGYWATLMILAPTEMIIDGIRDGVIDGTYDPNIHLSHSIMVIKEKGEYFLVNSLGKWNNPPTTYNKYKITKEQLQRIQKGDNYYFIY